VLTVSRMDLDGPTSPSALVTKILKAEPALTAPIPIDAVARQLDIVDIKDLQADGFVGGLITDVSRSEGFILVKRGLMEERRRFTVGHELGHFLMVHHKPTEGRFLCTAADMNRRAGRREQLPPAQRWEVEANEFASLLLMPPPMWRKEMAPFRNPDLSQIAALARTFGVSRDAAARTYAAYHDQLVAVALVKDGVLERIYRDATRFPALALDKGAPVPRSSIYHRAKKLLVQPSEMVEAKAEFWLRSDWGQRLPELAEQVLFRQDGYAFILLWAEIETPDDYDREEDRTSKQRLADRQAKYVR
jgi:Zn-dependent peptidase ImmA (M78 family)